MIKRAPSRNARTRGFKVKHVLQICLLLGVCFWLIYQLKHSHDKKKEFDEYDAKISVRTQSDVGISNLGRKGLHPRVQELSKDKKHEEEDDEETTVDDEVNKMEENKHEQKQVEGEAKYEEDEREEGTKHIEEEQEEGTKHEEEEREEEESKNEEEEREEGNKHEDDEQEEEIEDERRGGGDDEIGEHDQEKIGEADHEEDLVDGERGREEQGEEKESGNDEAEDKEAQTGHETSTEDQDNDGGVQNDHEAREEHYKADDASSAVTHDSQTISAEAENTSSDNSNDNSVTHLELERNSNSINTNDVSGDEKNSQSQLEGGVAADNDPPPNATAAEKKDDKIINTEDLSTKHATFSSLSNDQPVLSNTSKDVNVEAGNNPGGRTETSGSSQHNGTLLTSDSNQVQNATINGASTGEASNLKTTEWVQVNNSIVSGNIEINSISSIPVKTWDNISDATTSNFSANSEPAGLGKVIKPEVTAEAEVRPDGSDKIIKPEPEVNAEAEVKPDGSDKVIEPEPEPEVNSVVNSKSSSTIKETAHDANESGGTEENLGSSATDGTEAVHDHTDSSVGQEEKEARIDLETLPGDIGEGVNSRDAAAE